MQGVHRLCIPATDGYVSMRHEPFTCVLVVHDTADWAGVLSRQLTLSCAASRIASLAEAELACQRQRCVLQVTQGKPTDPASLHAELGVRGCQAKKSSSQADR